MVPAKSKVGHHLAKLIQSPDVFGLILLGKLDDQDRIGIAAHRCSNDGLEHRNLAPEREHGAIHQLHRDRAKLYIAS